MTVACCDTCHGIDEGDPKELLLAGWVIVDERWRCPECRRPIAE